MFDKLLRLFNKIWLTPEEDARKQGVKIGKNCNIQIRSFGSEPYLVEIGNWVQITSGTKFFTHGGGWVFREEYPKFDTFGKIKIGNNVYIGNNTLIMPGVSIGNNIIIAAGSVVTKSFYNDGSIIGGNPARIIGSLDRLKDKILPYNLDCKGLNPEEKKKLLLSLPDNRFIKK